MGWRTGKKPKRDCNRDFNHENINDLVYRPTTGSCTDCDTCDRMSDCEVDAPSDVVIKYTDGTYDTFRGVTDIIDDIESDFFEIIDEEQELLALVSKQHVMYIRRMPEE